MTTTDDEGSTLTRVYDKVGNVIRTTEVELDVAGYAAGTFHTETFYDALNRPNATVSNLGNTQRFLYDSRDLLVQSSDAMGTVTGTISDLPSAGEHGTFPQGGSLAINRRGNTSRFTYDGLGRSLSSIRDLRQDGTGMSVVVGQIATSQTYDDNGRVAQRFDPNGNVTGYAYDHQNRQIREIFADGTEHRSTWNQSGTLALDVDPRGVSKAFTYDALERRSDVAISGRPPGAGQTTFQAFDFDGLGRRTKGEDDDSRVETCVRPRVGPGSRATYQASASG